MKPFINLKSPFNKVMIILICILIGIIIAGTLYGLVNRTFENKQKDNGPSITLTPMPETSELQSLNKRNDTNISAYTGFGTLRAVTKVEEGEDFGTALVITPWFSYKNDDSAFFEELSRKRVMMIGLFTGYFSSKTYSQLQSIGEEKMKADLLNIINSQLSLGKIQQIFFTDFIFLN